VTTQPNFAPPGAVKLAKVLERLTKESGNELDPRYKALADAEPDQPVTARAVEAPKLVHPSAIAEEHQGSTILVHPGQSVELKDGTVIEAVGEADMEEIRRELRSPVHTPGLDIGIVKDAQRNMLEPSEEVEIHTENVKDESSLREKLVKRFGFKK
jgi:hypothetical protein